MLTDLTFASGIKNDFSIYGIKSTTKKELYVYIAGPNGGCIPLRFIDSDKNAIKVVYIPRIEGEHKVFIKFGGVPIKGSPFKVQIRGRAPFLTLEEKVGRAHPPDSLKTILPSESSLRPHRLSHTPTMTTDFHLTSTTR